MVNADEPRETWPAARHPWVARADADAGVRFGVCLAARTSRRSGADAPAADVAAAANPTASVLAAARLADTLEYDGVFLPDHPASRNDPLVLGAAIAAVTTRVKIGALALSPLYRHPGVLLRGLADLDGVSDGRALLGIGLGGNGPDLRQLGIEAVPTAARAERLRTVLALLRQGWSGEPVTYADSVTPAPVQMHAWRILPPGVQERVPVIIAGGGERRTLRLVAELADACNLQPDRFLEDDLTPEMIRHKLEVLRRHCADIGRDPDSVLVSAWNGFTICAPTEAEVRQKVHQYAPNGLRPSAAIYHCGTPQQLAEYYTARVRAGVQYMVVQPIVAHDHESLHLIASEVLPAVRAAVRAAV